MRAGRVGLALLLAGCGASREPAPQVQPDLALLLASGLRADVPGSVQAASTFLSNFTSWPGTRFNVAWASSPSQLVSLGALVTGRHPSSIPLCGLTHKGPQGETDRPWCSQLPKDRPSLPDILALYGYRTALFRDHAPGLDTVGARFHHQADTTSPSPGTDWSALLAGTSAWWSENASSPRLLVVVVSDLQYAARPDLEASLGVQGWTGEEEAGRRELPRLRGEAMRQYEKDASRVGTGFSSLLAGLEPAERPRWVAISSTNGVSLGEIGGVVSQRDFFFSSSLVLDRTVRVPLLLLGGERGAEGLQERDDGVQLFDILPTFLHLAGAREPAGMAARDLLAPPDPDRVAYAEIGDMIGVRKGPYALTFRVPMHNCSSLDPRLDQALSGPEVGQYLFLFDLLRDPRQERALRGERWVPVFRDLYDELTRIRKGPGAPPPDVLTPERAQELRLSASEGYW